jgi:hypothetical protein
MSTESCPGYLAFLSPSCQKLQGNNYSNLLLSLLGSFSALCLIFADGRIFSREPKTSVSLVWMQARQLSLTVGAAQKVAPRFQHCVSYAPEVMDENRMTVLDLGGMCRISLEIFPTALLLPVAFV